MPSRKTNKAKRVDGGCRNHGACPWCRGNRTYQGRKAKQAADEAIEEVKRKCRCVSKTSTNSS